MKDDHNPSAAPGSPGLTTPPSAIDRLRYRAVTKLITNGAAVSTVVGLAAILVSPEVPKAPPSAGD